MVYISPDGRVLESRPWSLGRITDIFWGFVNFVTQFFSSLVGLDRAQIQSGRGRGGTSGGSGPGGPGDGGPGGPRNRNVRGMKDISSIQDCSMPGGG